MNIQVESGDIWAMGESVAAELSTGTFFSFQNYTY
jgi:hypothetical protein